MRTHSDSEVLYVFGLGKLYAVGQGLNRAIRRVLLDEEPVDVLAQRPHHQVHHHALEYGVKIEKLVGFQLEPLFLNLLLELAFAMLNLDLINYAKLLLTYQLHCH